MSSLISELQHEIISQSHSIADLLRKGLVVASKLKLRDFEKWILNELEGYFEATKIPIYRSLTGEIEVFNYNINRWMPINIGSEYIENRICTIEIQESVFEIEKMLEQNDNIVVYSIPRNDELKLMREHLLDNKPSLIILKTQIASIIDIVKTNLLKWCLRLEKANIIGEGLSFTPKEVEKAQNIYVNNFFDKVSNSQINSNSKKSKQNN
ncbi:hypothetical protein [Flavobacterium filum]|uniref:AbiTii domain-containing protein n=1 Tax=Flavobacterium filum TaxID=370974 RepID=UPI0023F495DD|nr:hypothetical protein [Flavobacterium filum]